MQSSSSWFVFAGLVRHGEVNLTKQSERFNQTTTKREISIMNTDGWEEPKGLLTLYRRYFHSGTSSLQFPLVALYSFT